MTTTSNTSPLTNADDDMPFRVAPHNIEAEQALLGAILVNNSVHDRISAFLEGQHFYDPLNARIFETIGRLVYMGKQATPITLRTFFENEENIVDDLTVPQYLARLAANATSIINVEAYGQTILQAAIRRNLILIGDDMVNDAYDADIEQPPEKQIELAEQRLYEIAENNKYGKGFVSFADALVDAIEMANNAYKRDGGLSGLSTGLRDLDQRMGGLQASDLIVLAGRPSMGKTALATNIAFNVAKAHRSETGEDGVERTVDGGIVGFFSLEMSSEQLATRIISEQSEITSEKIRRGMINRDQFEKLYQVSKQLDEIPLFIDESGGISVAQLAARARRLKRRHGLDLIVVDYLQLLSGSSRRSDNRVQEITEITTNLKAMAKELEVPILALSQLSRQVENRDDKRPLLSDLRESGSIEQDADVVMFVYREEYYINRAKPPESKHEEHNAWIAEMDRVDGLAELIVGKQRHGPTGTVQVKFEGQFTRFSDLAKEDHMPERFD